MDRGRQSASRLRNDKETTYSVAQLAKIDTNEIEYTKEYNELTERLNKLESGVLDDELKKEIKEVTKVADDKTRVKMKKKMDEKVEKAELSVISKAFYQAGRKQDRKNRYEKKGMGRCYKHFLRATDSVPDYMKRNLKDMPNNKGYYWKSVACFGKRPAERGKPTILFDRKRGGIMVIHEWTSSQYNVYEKKGKGRRIRVSSVIRRHKKGAFPIEESSPQGDSDFSTSNKGGNSRKRTDRRGGSNDSRKRTGGGSNDSRKRTGGGSSDSRKRTDRSRPETK